MLITNPKPTHISPYIQIYLRYKQFTRKLYMPNSSRKSSQILLLVCDLAEFAYTWPLQNLLKIIHVMFIEINLSKSLYRFF